MLTFSLPLLPAFGGQKSPISVSNITSFGVARALAKDHKGTMKSTKPGKAIQAMLDDGTIWVENGSYVGRASDGIIVALGTVGFEKDLERYLTACPSPDRW